MATKIEERVKEVFGTICTLPENCDRTLVLKSLMLDSLDLVDLVQSLEEEFCLKIDDNLAPGWTTLGDIFDYIEKNYQGK
jgi:acyl carrier protein